MCAICLDFEKGKLNIKEARRNLSEIYWTTLDPNEADHMVELRDRLDKLQDNETD